MELINKYAVITGASTGIGREIANILSKEGAFVALVARRRDKLDETLKIITENGGRGKIFECDLTNINALNTLVEDIRKDTKQVDIVCNVAGIWHGKDEVYAEIDYDNFKQKVILDTLSVGITAPMLLIHGLLPIMQKNSKVINISGTFENGAKGWLPYYVSKKAIEDFTIGLSEELAGKGIQVNCISPSDTATEEYRKYFPQYIEDAVIPEDIAKYALFLTSEKAEGLTGKIKVIKKRVLPKVIEDVGFDFHWEEEKVWALDIPVEEMNINELEWHFDIPFWFKQGGYYDLKPIDVINNPKDYIWEYGRTMASDLSYPLDIMHWKNNWLLLDGLHRLAKAHVLGYKTVKVRKIPVEAIPQISK